MTIILNGTTGVTFPNGVTMSDGTSAPVTVAQGGTGANTASAARTALGVAIGTDVLAPNGSGANLTSLNASNISSGTLAVARGGTGTATPSLVGGTNITISGTWPNQTVTAAGGGVTSLNGQTGAITNTDLGAIGSVVLAGYNSASGVYTGQTVSGSNLYVPTAISQQSTSAYIGINYYSQYTSTQAYSNWSAQSVSRVNSGNTGFQLPQNSTTLSGTWRCMGWSTAKVTIYDGCLGVTTSLMYVTNFVRVS